MPINQIRFYHKILKIPLNAVGYLRSNILPEREGEKIQQLLT